MQYIDENEIPVLHEIELKFADILEEGDLVTSRQGRLLEGNVEDTDMK